MVMHSVPYTYNGLVLASPVLSDGQLSFTPGLSQTLGTPNGSGGLSYASHFYAEDAVGNLRFMTDGAAQRFPDGWGWDGFGSLVAHAGSTPAPFGFGEASGYVTDGDSGLRLLGHRYYDSRTGRFISQDPAGDGDNWYAYCDNDPTDAVDPLGLSWQDPNPGDHQPGTGSWDNGDPTGMVGNQYTNKTGERVTHWVTDAGYAAGSFIDNWVTFGTITHAGQVMGAYDSGHASRGAAFGSGALAVGAIVAAGVTQGKDAAVVDVGRGIGGWIVKDVFRTLRQDVGKENFEKFLEALNKGVVGPEGKAGIKELNPAFKGYTHELKINGSAARLLGNVGTYKGEAKVFFRELRSAGLHKAKNR